MHGGTLPTSKPLFHREVTRAAGAIRSRPPSRVQSYGSLVRRGLIGVIGTVFFLNGWFKGALALLAVAALWENWLQFHPWLGVVIALLAVAILVIFPDRPLHEAEPPAVGKDPDEDELLRGACRITISRDK